tara:strand:+ start:1026 stop:1166 length:141 start_codon:yes stop_codon:yes gene_type:complete
MTFLELGSLELVILLLANNQNNPKVLMVSKVLKNIKSVEIKEVMST